MTTKAQRDWQRAVAQHTDEDSNALYFKGELNKAYRQLAEEYHLDQFATVANLRRLLRTIEIEATGESKSETPKSDFVSTVGKQLETGNPFSDSRTKGLLSTG